MPRPALALTVLLHLAACAEKRDPADPDGGTGDGGTGTDGGTGSDSGTGTDGGTGNDGGTGTDGGTETDGGSGLLTFYRDADGDGYGDPAAPFEAVVLPIGYVDDHQDCDDSNRDIHPGVPERCDGVDEDCDGEVDEDAVDASELWLDADGDGYGGGEATTACPEEGWVDRADDCDDDDPEVNPGVAERCDGIDRDCDGEIDSRFTVPGAYDSIEAAWAAMPDGGLVCVEAGRHELNLGRTSKSGTIDGPVDAVLVGGESPLATVPTGRSFGLGSLTLEGGEGMLVEGTGGDLLLRETRLADGRCSPACQGWLSVDGGSIRLAGVVVEDNELSHDSMLQGGLVRINGGVLTIDGLQTGGNTLTSPGMRGGLIYSSSSTVMASDVVHGDDTVACAVASSSTALGGLWYLASSTASWSDLLIDGTRAEVSEGTMSGPLVAVASGSFTWVGGGVQGVEASSQDGSLQGLLYIFASTATLRDLTLSDNSLQVDTGTSMLLTIETSARAELFDVSVTGNRAEGLDEGSSSQLVALGGELTWEGGSLSENEIVDGGSGYTTLIYIGGLDETLLSDLDLHGNTISVDEYGTLLFAHGGGSLRRLDLRDNRVSSSTGDGSAALLRSGNGSVLDATNLVLAGNSLDAGLARGLLYFQGRASLSYLTVVGNDASGATWAGGLLEADEVSVMVDGSTFSGNRVDAPDAPATLFYGNAGSSVGFGWTNAWDNEGGDADIEIGRAWSFPSSADDNLATDPLHVDTSSALATDWDLGLDGSSPLVDAGPDGDLDPDGSPADVGAYGGPYGSW